MCLAPHDYTVSRNSEWLDTFRVVVVDFRVLKQSRASLWRRSFISVLLILLLFIAVQVLHHLHQTFVFHPIDDEDKLLLFGRGELLEVVSEGGDKP